MSPTIAEFLRRAEEDIKGIRVLIKEGLYSIALSRCYYAMFYLAEAILLTEGKSYSKHSAVISALGRDFAQTGRFPQNLHHYLVKAQNLRLVSDYVISKRFSKEEAEEQLHHAEEFLAAARPLLEGKD